MRCKTQRFLGWQQQSQRGAGHRNGCNSRNKATAGAGLGLTREVQGKKCKRDLFCFVLKELFHHLSRSSSALSGTECLGKRLVWWHYWGCVFPGSGETCPHAVASPRCRVPALELAPGLSPARFPSLQQGAPHSPERVWEERAGRCSAMGPALAQPQVSGPPSPGTDRAEPPQMEKADAPASYLNESHSALLVLKHAFSQPDPSCP